MHDFLKFVFYLGVIVQLFHYLVRLFIPGKVVEFFDKLGEHNKETAERKELGMEPVNTTKWGCVSAVALSFLIGWFAMVFLGLLTSNWYVFLLLIIFSVLTSGINKLRKEPTKVTVVGVIIYAFINVVLLIYALINAYQLHYSFRDVLSFFGI